MVFPIDTTLIPKPSLGKSAKQYLQEMLQKLHLSQEKPKNLNQAKEKSKAKA